MSKTGLNFLSFIRRRLPFLRSVTPQPARRSNPRGGGGGLTKPTALIVSGADYGYFPYLQELWLSYRASGADGIADFGVLNLGLDVEQRGWLEARNVALVDPDWPYEGLESQPNWFKAMVCRPFLPKLFPGHEFVFWIDADSWIQDAHALTLFIEGVRRDGFTVVPAIDRGYRPDYQPGGWFLEWNKACIEKGFGENLAEQFYRRPIISAGAICGASKAPHWKVWQDHTEAALKRAIYREVEQTALCMTVYLETLPVHFLPSHCHWVCNMGFPVIDTERGLFVEPYEPYTPIGIMGLAENTKNEAFLLRTMRGEKVSTTLRFRSIRGA